MKYIAYLHKNKGSDFGVSFPDFPGCVTAESAGGGAGDGSRGADFAHGWDDRGWRGAAGAVDAGPACGRSRDAEGGGIPGERGGESPRKS